MAHTPSPWIIIRDYDEKASEIKGSGNIICQFWNSQRDFGNSESNSRLIVSAPELLTAVKEAKKFLNEKGYNGPFSDYLRDMIEKAEGK